MMRLLKAVFVLVFSVLSIFLGVAGGGGFPEVTNSQKENDHPPTPKEAVAKIALPKGFKVTLFAGEPDVQQPIGFEIDDQARLWVAENYTYKGRGFSDAFNDRIIILADTNQDGKHDKRTVFWNKGKRLSGITLGFGGVWALNFGKLIFIADRNHDDKPDGEPVVLLDGFSCDKISHNVVNGLMWGPDGWLYGRHGIQGTSLVGAPGAAESKRTKLNCAIWRYHPTRKVFEVVCHGTTNPWGMDYDRHGQFFFTNNVNGHLWHMVPGAFYKRMHGQHFNKNLYELIDQTADHQHWDTTKKWSQARDAKGKNDEAGGGHSHCGGMIYQGDSWPKQYRNKIFMCNTHGRRLNVNTLSRDGNGYVGKQQPDFLFANQPWFRGIELKYGPNGEVYLTDWVDNGECHDNDGVHRTSGRIYRITHKDLYRKVHYSKMDNEILVSMFNHENAWFPRTGRRLLQERAARGDDMAKTVGVLMQIVFGKSNVNHRLRALWTLYSMNQITEETLIKLLADTSEHLRVWAIRLLTDDGRVTEKALKHFEKMAGDDASGLVRLYLASTLQRLPLEKRWALAQSLAQHEGDADDRVQPLMIWYGIEAAVSKDKQRGIRLAAKSKIPKLRQLIARRIAGN